MIDNVLDGRRLTLVEFPWAQAITAASTLIAVWLTNHFSRKRGIADTLWDIRRSTYGVILSELKQVEIYADMVDEWAQQTSWHDIYNAENYLHAQKKAFKRLGIATSRFRDDYLTTSIEFRTIFEKMRLAWSGMPDSDPPDEHEALAEAIRLYRPQLLALAELELAKLQGKSFFRIISDNFKN